MKSSKDWSGLMPEVVATRSLSVSVSMSLVSLEKEFLGLVCSWRSRYLEALAPYMTQHRSMHSYIERLTMFKSANTL